MATLSTNQYDTIFLYNESLTEDEINLLKALEIPVNLQTQSSGKSLKDITNILNLQEITIPKNRIEKNNVNDLAIYDLFQANNKK